MKAKIKNKRMLTIVVSILLIGFWYLLPVSQDYRNTHVYFYGKVVDQHGNPVSNALVKTEIGKWRILDANSSYYQFKTDSQGNFSIEDIGAINMIVGSIEKDGYEIKAGTYLQGYKRDANDPAPLWSETSKEKPWIFHAWKKTEAEPLVYDKGLFGFKFDGRKYTINFKTGKKLEGIVNSGDLVVSIWRNPNSSRSNVGDWKVSLEAISGGLIETMDVFMNEAPEAGYSSSWSMDYKKNASNYKRKTSWEKFYLKSRNRLYIRLEMEIIPYFNDKEAAIDMKIWMNPNGSRNLQYDPKKRIYLK